MICVETTTEHAGEQMPTRDELLAKAEAIAASKPTSLLDLIPPDRTDVEAMRTLRGPSRPPAPEPSELEHETCPRCLEPMREPFYGPCSACRDQLAGRTEAAPTGNGEGGDGSGAGEGQSVTPAYTTKRARRRYKRKTRTWVELKPTILEQLSGEVGEVVHTFGPRPDGTIAGVRAWADGPLPEGWRPAPAGHWLHGAFPVLRYLDPAGEPVEVHRGEAWFGDGATPTEAAGAWAELEAILPATFGDGAMPLSSPATTGRDLVLRCVPFGHEGWPVLSLEHQELIRSTSGQGRIELMQMDADTLPQITKYDGRFMYSALCWGLPAGIPVHDNGADYLGQTRARYMVDVTVPAGWDHVGILGVKDGAAGWEYPNEPGRTFTTWADGAELGIAYAFGWTCQIRQRLIFPTYKGRGPLDTWAEKLRAIRSAHLESSPLVAGAVRSILLHSIGALHGRGHRQTRHGELSEVPDDARDWRRSGELYSWTVDAGQAWANLAHPEWSAAIWARARARLLDGPGGRRGERTGMLNLPPDVILATRTDALYLTTDPGWSDDGADGRLRHVTTIPGPMPTPTTTAALLELTAGG